jgi:uncharacterized RDD family membrane protein YckC
MSQTILPQPSPDWLLTQGVPLRRILAFFVDCFLISVVSWGLAIFFGIFGFFTLGLGWMMLHILPWLPWIYFTLFIGSEGSTPGQRSLGLVVRQDADLTPPNLAQALVWTLLLWVSFVFAGIPFLLALISPRHRTAHDLLSGLVVVRRPQLSY